MTDLSGALNFIVLAIVGLVLTATYFTRQIVLTSLVTIWGVRLGGFLLYRVLIRGKDNRFDEIRGNFWSFLGFWIFQMVWVFTVSLPVSLTNAAKNDSKLNALDYVGWALWLIGFLIETIADFQKFAYIQDQSPDKAPFLSTGLWSWSRHPNYFGEILLWSGVFLSSCNAYRTEANSMTYGYVAILSPVLTALLLLFLSGMSSNVILMFIMILDEMILRFMSPGMPLAEEKSDKRYGDNDDYIRYKASTSPLFPMPPSVYRHMPSFVKTWLLLELPIYNKLRDNKIIKVD